MKVEQIMILVANAIILAVSCIIDTGKGFYYAINTVAGAIAGNIREQGKTELQTIGTGALNQAIKAIGIDLICIPAFHDVEVDGEERTAIKLIIEPR